MRGPRAVVIVVAVAAFVAACGSSGAKTSGSSNPTTTAPPAVVDRSLGPGVTATTIKLGIMMFDYSCVAGAIDFERPDQQRDYQVFVDDINNKGGINGRKIVPVYKTFCPVSETGQLAACTSLTEDNRVFAAVGTLYDATGAAQLCFAKTHNTPVITDSLTEAIINRAPPGLLLTPDITSERRLRVIMSLLETKGILNGKKVATVADAANVGRAKALSGPCSSTGVHLCDLGATHGTDAVLDISGLDTTSAQAQLDSFIEHWKTEHTTAVILVGEDVSSKQFVARIKAAVPNMVLIADTTGVLTGGQEEQKAGVSPNPYDGILTAEGQTGLEHTKTPHFAYCRDIFEKATGQKVPSPLVVVKLPNGKENQIYGEVEDACLFVNFFTTIAKRVGPYLNDANWANAVNHFGAIDDTSTIYATIHSGKYDADDTYGLVAYDHTIGDAGDWTHVTSEQNVGNA